MRVTLRCGSTFSHKTRGRESLFNRWSETFGDHSCTLLHVKNMTIPDVHKHHLLTCTVVLTLSASNLNVIIAACAASWICYRHKYNLYAARCMRPHCFYINSVCSQLATCKTPMPANARNSDLSHYIFSQNTGA